MRIEMGIEQFETKFLFTGKLNTNKQPVPLAEAFLMTLDSGAPDAHLVFVGSSSLEEELRLRFDYNTRIHLVGSSRIKPAYPSDIEPPITFASCPFPRHGVSPSMRLFSAVTVYLLLEDLAAFQTWRISEYKQSLIASSRS